MNIYGLSKRKSLIENFVEFCRLESIYSASRMLSNMDLDAHGKDHADIILEEGW